MGCVRKQLFWISCSYFNMSWGQVSESSKKLSGSNETIFESASRFCKYKEKFKKLKGKLYMIFSFKNSGYLFTTRRTSILKSRRVERHQYWHNYMPWKIARPVPLSKNARTCNFIKMGVVQLVCTSGRALRQNVVDWHEQFWRIGNHFWKIGKPFW